MSNIIIRKPSFMRNMDNAITWMECAKHYMAKMSDPELFECGGKEGV